MKRTISIASLVLFSTLVFACGAAFAGQIAVTVNNDAAGGGWRFDPSGPYVVVSASDTFIVTNSTSEDPVSVDVYFKSTGGTTIDGKTIAAASLDSLFMGGTGYERYICVSEGGEEKVCEYIGYPGTPSLTQWGIVGLVVLLLASTVLIMLRRRKAAVPA